MIILAGYFWLKGLPCAGVAAADDEGSGVNSQAFSGSPDRHPAIRAGEVRLRIVQVVAVVIGILLMAFSGMLSFSWIVEVGPKLEADSTWALNIVTWFVSFVSEVSWALVAWLSLPLVIGLLAGFFVWGTFVAPRILTTRAVTVYIESLKRVLTVQEIDFWMRTPSANIQERMRNEFAGSFVKAFLVQLVSSTLTGFLAGGLVVGVTAAANLTSSGWWGNVAFVAAVAIIAAFAYELITSVPGMVSAESYARTAQNPESTQ